jgi:hypothetical protein
MGSCYILPLVLDLNLIMVSATFGSTTYRQHAVHYTVHYHDVLSTTAAFVHSFTLPSEALPTSWLA